MGFCLSFTFSCREGDVSPLGRPASPGNPVGAVGERTPVRCEGAKRSRAGVVGGSWQRQLLAGEPVARMLPQVSRLESGSPVRA